MAFNIHLVKKWTKMLLGKSIYHVEQGVGRYYSKVQVLGFYNDLREKVYKRTDKAVIPVMHTDDGDQLYFPIEIAQYGLGAFDIYLETKDEYYLNIAESCAKWLFDNQNDIGGWKTFGHIYAKHPYSSMAQSEGACLFMRLYSVNKEDEYLLRSKKAIDFMLVPLDEGGCTYYDGDDVYLCEYTDPSRDVVLNGWIFSIWCLYDYLKIKKDTHIEQIYNKTLRTLCNSLHRFDIKFWSLYDLSGRITSPFYHKLHLAQLEVMYDITGEDAFNEWYKKWQNYQRSTWKSMKAFIIKATQKLLE